MNWTSCRKTVEKAKERNHVEVVHEHPDRFSGNMRWSFGVLRHQTNAVSSATRAMVYPSCWSL